MTAIPPDSVSKLGFFRVTTLSSPVAFLREVPWVAF